MIGHLGARVSALLDGQLSAKETEEAWAHVYACHACRDLVEREGWVKTRLAGLCTGEREVPSGLKGSLMSMPPGEALLGDGNVRHGARRTGAVMLGGSAVGAAILGVVALGFAPGSTPPADRRPPVTQINTSIPASPSTPGPTPTNGRVSVGNGLGTVLPTPVRRMLP